MHETLPKTLSSRELGLATNMFKKQLTQEEQAALIAKGLSVLGLKQMRTEDLGIDIPDNFADPRPLSLFEFNGPIRCYGANYVVRQYCGWPDELPLPIGWSHSYDLYGRSYGDYELCPTPHYWVPGDREHQFISWAKLIAPPHLHRMGHPALYLKPNTPPEKREGTIAFPDHPGYSTVPAFFDKYLHEISNLPSKFHPVTICLTRQAIEQLGTLIKDSGLNIVCLGLHNEKFFETHREVVQRFEYATSNYSGFASVFTPHWGCKYFNSSEPAILYDTTHDKYNRSVLMYPKLFSQANVENELELKGKVVDYHLGRKYRREPHLLRNFLWELTREVTYRLLFRIDWIMKYSENKEEDYENAQRHLKTLPDPCKDYKHYHQFDRNYAEAK